MAFSASLVHGRACEPLQTNTKEPYGSGRDPEKFLLPLSEVAFSRGDLGTYRAPLFQIRLFLSGVLAF